MKAQGALLPEPFSRGPPPHFTGSAMVTDGRRVALVHHRKLGRWLQPGGTSRQRTRRISSPPPCGRRPRRRGVPSSAPTAQQPLDVDVHPIPSRATEPGAPAPRRPLPRGDRSPQGRCARIPRRAARSGGSSSTRRSIAPGRRDEAAPDEGSPKWLGVLIGPKALPAASALRGRVCVRVRFRAAGRACHPLGYMARDIRRGETTGYRGRTRDTCVVSTAAGPISTSTARRVGLATLSGYGSTGCARGRGAG
jgi:hypothetical protein